MYISLDTWQRYLINVQKSKEYWFESKNILGFINNCVFQVVSFRYDLFICTHTRIIFYHTRKLCFRGHELSFRRVRSHSNQDAYIEMVIQPD